MTPAAARRPAALADRLRSAILEGSLPPGTHLRQAELAHQLGVSTTPLREAIGRLAHEGLVDLDEFKGARVHVLSADELDQIYRVRLQVLPLSVAHSLPHATPRSLKTAAALLERMEPITRTSEWVVGNREFHKVLDECAGRTIYSQIMVQMADMAMLYIGSLFEHSADWTQEKAEHREILAAYVARDEAAAVDLLTRHFEKTWKSASGNITATGPADGTADREEQSR
ncbi:MAG: GntR family transcriptional regulator [Actinocatenispora sp.]